MSDTAAIAEPQSALPSVRARVVAFVGILVAGALGGLCAYFFMGTQCDDCAVATGAATWFGTVVMALGAAVIAVISLRTITEWTPTRRA